MKTLHQTNRAKTYEAFMLVHSAPDTLATIYIERETEHFVYYVGGKADRKRSPSRTISSDLQAIKALQAEHQSRMANVRAYDLKRARGTHLLSCCLTRQLTPSTRTSARTGWKSP
jgi:hypothetical protein